MRTARAAAVLGLLAAGGCWPSHPEAPEEGALEVYEDAEAHFAAGRYADAIPEYEFVIRARNRWKDPYVKLARCHEATGREDEAVQVLDRWLAYDRFDEDALCLLGRLCARRGATDRALDCYRRLRELRPGDRSLDGEIARLEAMRKP
jgi:DNA-binding SARP family transcriptional activator